MKAFRHRLLLALAILCAYALIRTIVIRTANLSPSLLRLVDVGFIILVLYVLFKKDKSSGKL